MPSCNKFLERCLNAVEEFEDTTGWTSRWDQFTSDSQAAAMRLDSLRSSHPIQVPIHRAEEVEEVFDAISYCKGASVIKMAHAYLGAEAFRTGLRAYMQQHKQLGHQLPELLGNCLEHGQRPQGERVDGLVDRADGCAMAGRHGCAPPWKN
eukprot:Skav219021  [mRNA]  locus=scaffold2142:391521:397343:+ [translate_table: standard]